MIEGEAGIGKTTLWLDAIIQARQQGFRVLSARAGQAESGLAYAVLADLFDDVAPEELAGLPYLQRVALDRALLKEDGTGPATDQRVAAAAFLTLVDHLSSDTPTVIALDDVQWLDASSRTVVAFAARRLKGRIGFLLSERTEAATGSGATWLELTRLDGIHHVRVSPLSLGGLRSMIADRLGRALPRPTIVRISELSGGNPFYALELARALDTAAPTFDATLPDSLFGLVRSRLDQLGEETLTVLLVAACLGETTVDFLAAVTKETAECVVDLLEAPESNGIVQIEGNRVRFTHPLLARGVYSVVGPARRRHMHRTLGDFIEQPELRARHLALAASSADPTTLQALDAAAASARARGAPAEAGELLDLAINLGADDPERRIQCAEHHFRAGESSRAEKLLVPIVDQLPPGTLRVAALNLLAGIRIYDDSLPDAVVLLDRALSEDEGDPVLIVWSLLLSSFALLYLGRMDESVSRVEEALERARPLSNPELISQALAMKVLATCMRGDGVDEPSLQRALELEDLDADLPIHFRASAVRMFTDAWTGRLEEARQGAIDMRQLCLERGAESEVLAVAVHRSLVEVWRGDFASAEVAAAEAVDHAEHIGTQHLRGVALTSRAAAAAHLGRADDARRDAREALRIATDCGTPQLMIRATTLLGFIEVSLDNHADAVAVLQPLIDLVDVLPGVEIRNRDYVPDAVEAMINVGQIAEAEHLIDTLETNGRRLDRAWLLATGARCRGMWWAAHGDLDAALHATASAMAEHDRLPMPFERARTQLLLGHLQLRLRLKQAAADTTTEALRAFDGMGAELWAQRARRELQHVTAAGPQDSALTRSEQRIAELAMTGMMNRDIAATLVLSVKTVEWNLTQIYRKLDIRSRAQLARKLRP